MEGKDIDIKFIFQTLTLLDIQMHLKDTQQRRLVSFRAFKANVWDSTNQFAFNILHWLLQEKSLIGSDTSQTFIWQIIETNIDLSKEARSVTIFLSLTWILSRNQ